MINNQKSLLSILFVFVIMLMFTACGEDIDEIVEISDIVLTAVDEEINNQPEKITMEEFTALKNGMTYQQVVNIIGGEGTLTSEISIGWEKVTTYSWNGNHLGSSASISFSNGILNTKMQYGLE